MYSNFAEFIKNKQRLCIIQAENPDGDSLGSALALDYILEGHEVSLYCPVDIPKYLRYFPDWSRVTGDFDFKADGYIIVDTASAVLLSKLLDDDAIKNRLFKQPVFVIDHHLETDDLPFEHTSIIEESPACCEVIYRIIKDQKLPLTKEIAENLYSGLASDTLGLTSASVTAETFRAVADFVDAGLNIAEHEERRREFMKKSPRILNYKADLIKRIDYSEDGTLATVHIPFEDIQQYSDEYNPGVLILDELRLVEGVKVAVAIKTYPDGKVTGKIRTNEPIADQVAGYFGGGGHPYAAGFRTYDTNYTEVVGELTSVIPEFLTNLEKEQNETL